MTRNWANNILGKPYTPCVPTNAINTYGNYQVSHTATIYKENVCDFNRFVSFIRKYCDCYPSYIEYAEVSEQINKTGLKPCNFYQHGVCVSFIVERFKWGESGCLPACESYNFHLEFLHVSSE